MKNRFFSLATVAVLALSTACGGDEADGGDEATVDTDTSTLITQDTAAIVTTTTVDTIARPDTAEHDSID